MSRTERLCYADSVYEFAITRFDPSGKELSTSNNRLKQLPELEQQR